VIAFDHLEVRVRRVCHRRDDYDPPGRLRVMSRERLARCARHRQGGFPERDDPDRRRRSVQPSGHGPMRCRTRIDPGDRGGMNSDGEVSPGW